MEQAINDFYSFMAFFPDFTRLRIVESEMNCYNCIDRVTTGIGHSTLIVDKLWNFCMNEYC